MNIGQQSFIVFTSKLVSSVLGFVATIFFARVLGAEILGVFAVSMALISWLQLTGNMGMSSAVAKRVSEDTDKEEHAAAGFLFIIITGSTISLLIIIFSGRIDQYVGAPVTKFVILIFILFLFNNIVTSILSGRRKVHITGLLNGLKTIIVKAIQVILVLYGLKLGALLIGQWVGILIIFIIGMYFAEPGFTLPKYRHFQSLWKFARYSWLGALKSRAFNNIDILILGLFVPSSLVGVYSVCWTISKFLSLFDGAVSQVLFPEISYSETDNDPEAVSELVTEGLRFAGLITIPGVLGVYLVGDRLLRIYGPEFEQGSVVLVFLSLAIMIYGYQKQMLVGINGIDRPDLAFRINIIFIGVNILLNFILIRSVGWIGGAIATVVSALVGLILSTFILHNLADFEVPYKDLLNQVIAALIMSVFSYSILAIENSYSILEHNLLTLIIVVISGASSYFLILLVISTQFRKTVKRNSPIDRISIL